MCNQQPVNVKEPVKVSNLLPLRQISESGTEKVRIQQAFVSASMATNAGAGAARQLQSARTATAVWKVSYSVNPRRYSAESSRNILFSRMVYGTEFGGLLLLIRNGLLGSL